MNQDPKVIILAHKSKKKKNSLSDKEKIVYAYHYFQSNNKEEALNLLSDVSQSYYLDQFYKDISRALLCQATFKTTLNHAHGKESEFYLVVYRLVKIITGDKIHFNGSGHFYHMRDELFKDFM